MIQETRSDAERAVAEARIVGSRDLGIESKVSEAGGDRHIHGGNARQLMHGNNSTFCAAFGERDEELAYLVAFSFATLFMNWNRGHDHLLWNLGEWTSLN